MTALRRSLGIMTGCAVAIAGCSRPAPTTLAGRWDGTFEVARVPIPFQLEISGDGPSLEAALFDGDLRIPSSGGSYDNGLVRLAFAQYGTAIEARLEDGVLQGRYDRGTRGAPYPFRAVRAAERPNESGPVPEIAGEWKVPEQTEKGERAVRFLVQQNGAEVAATILRVDGDTGALTGHFRGGTFVLSHFSGARPMLLEVTPNADGSLTLVQNREAPLTAYRTSDPRASSLPEPADPDAHTRARDPQAPFTFSFPDLTGRTVANTDERFRNKVLAISMTGSWCPNCHDEAPFLVELYRDYRDRGLEIISFAFEEEAQLANPVRLKAFMKRFGIEYTVLLAGTPDELSQKVPQVENLNAFPTTIFVGRDGRIRSIHAGFASRAAGAFHEQGKAAVRATVERLLAEPGGNTD